VVTGLSFAIAAYALYWVYDIVPAQVYRPSFLLLALAVVFLSHPARARPDARVTALDWTLVALSAAPLLWPLIDPGGFGSRAATPSAVDLVLGALLIAVVLEATRRAVGPMLPVTAALFLAYAYAGPLLDRVGLSTIAHRGYSLERVIGTLYMTLEGIFGVPLDVAATYIVLFTIYGAVIERSGAGRFFVDWALAAIGRRGGGAAAGRTVVLAGYLLGAVSGSGVANTVTLGAVTWPMLRQAGYPAETGGAILAAAGIGAILAPPVMGAAAFLIAEFLGLTYLAVMQMAVIPAALYYLSIVLTVEADSRRLGPGRGAGLAPRTFVAVTREGWHHFASIATIVVLMVQGVTAFLAVFWATAVAAAASVFRREQALVPRRLAAALAAGGRAVVPIVAVTATAGIIVGVVTLTGLGLKAADLIVALAGGRPVATVLYAALAVWALGLAVPVTACYIIAAVMVAPALTQVGVAAPAAHMFVFYYAVLSEVSPPTALSPFAAAAVTGGNPYRTTLLTWKYALPAFLVPLVFTLSPQGTALLVERPALEVLWVSGAAALGVAAVALGGAGYLRRRARVIERALAVAGGLLLLSADLLAGAAGAVLVAAGAAMHWTRRGPGARPDG
jgi:TRAP transporter 4TM/12TM fusion protein